MRSSILLEVGRFGLAVLALASSTAAIADSVLVDQNEKTQKAFVVLQAEMTDQDMFFNQYAVPAEVEVARYGGKPLVASFDKSVFEGVWDNNWTIVLTFPNINAAEEWYFSENYQRVLPFRYAATEYGNMVFFEGTPESKIDWRIDRYKGAAATLSEPLTLDQASEYLVSIAYEQEEHRGFFRATGEFEPVDVSGGRLSLDLRLSGEEDIVGVSPRIRIGLMDTAGEVAVIGKTLRHNYAQQWQQLEFDIPASLGKLDTSSIKAVAIDVRLGPSLNRQRGSVWWKNLKIVN